MEFYKGVKLKRIKDGLGEDLEQHCRDVFGPKGTISWEILFRLGDSLHNFVAMDGDDMAGCAVYTVSKSLFGPWDVAQEVVFYLRPDYRRGALAVKFLKFTYKGLPRGRVLNSGRNPRWARQLEKMGHTKIDTMYQGELWESESERPF